MPPVLAGFSWTSSGKRVQQFRGWCQLTRRLCSVCFLFLAVAVAVAVVVAVVAA